MKPVSPYALSKLACFEICKYYKSVHKVDVRQAIAFNHESPFRNELFVTRKITAHIA
jgi:GDPmannose 4,6-dehydratase